MPLLGDAVVGLSGLVFAYLIRRGRGLFDWTAIVVRNSVAIWDAFMRSIAKLMGLDLDVPDYPTLSRRGKGLKIAQNRRASDKPITLLVDSTGLKMHGGNGWHEEKHGSKKVRKTWRKLHIAFDPDTGEISASELTTEHVGDETALPDLLTNIEAGVDQFLAPSRRLLRKSLPGNGWCLRRSRCCRLFGA